MLRENRRVIIIAFISIFIFLIGYAQTQKASVPDEILASNKIEYKSEGLRDPFQQDFTVQIEPKKQDEVKTKPLPPLEIQGIVWGGRLPQAIINNKVVKIGDTIGEAQVININKEGVTVFFDNREYNLSSPATVNLQEIKQSP